MGRPEFFKPITGIGTSRESAAPGRLAPATTRRLLLAVGILLTAVAIENPVSSAWGALTPLASAAHSLNVTDTAYLHYVDGSGSTLIESGPAYGSLPGSISARVQTDPANLSGSFTIRPGTGGTIRGHARATLNSSGADPSFKGVLVVSGGSGRYAHAHGSANIYGTYNRRSYALTVQPVGKLHY